MMRNAAQLLTSGRQIQTCIGRSGARPVRIAARLHRAEARSKHVRVVLVGTTSTHARWNCSRQAEAAECNQGQTCGV